MTSGRSSKWLQCLIGAGFLWLLFPAEVLAFDYASYQPGDLDIVSSRKPSAPGADIYPPVKYRFEVTLVSQATSCSTGFLKIAAGMAGLKEFLDRVPISRCVQVKTGKGRQLSLFIQDALSEGLAKEVPLGGKVTLYAMLIYVDQDTSGIVVNEFSYQNTSNEKAAADCGCGRDLHSGLDYSAKEGTPIPVADDGVVVRVEQNQQAVVETASAGECGRYVVVKHTYPDGRSLYTRYAQLGRLIGKDGKPITVGQTVKKKDQIGLVGSKGLFHFEVRPVDEAKTDRSAEWAQRYGADATMEWSKYTTVDPSTFKFPASSGRKGAAATNK